MLTLIFGFLIIKCQPVTFLSKVDRISRSNTKFPCLEHKNARYWIVVETSLDHTGYHIKAEEDYEGRKRQKAVCG